MDPRLLFHQAFVPIVGGLPDFTLVPKLVLPMGWKHVSWSGLLPIAFDPYRQAFKLTPVGAIPLTREELKQQGLQKYVPGGELHPEFSLLPEMLKLSDGSDAEVYNFDGVDWTLPWEGQVDFHAPRRTIDQQCNGGGTNSPTNSNTFIPMITYPWREARDCPNKIFDLSDAWRWLSEKEPTIPLTSSPRQRRIARKRSISFNTQAQVAYPRAYDAFYAVDPYYTKHPTQSAASEPRLYEGQEPVLPIQECCNTLHCEHRPY